MADPESRIAASDFIVRPSRDNDPWGRDVIETMSHGKVIIATGYFDGFVKNGVNGFIIGEWDVNHVADIIIDTWSTGSLREDMSKRDHFAKKEFAPETAASKFTATLADLKGEVMGEPDIMFCLPDFAGGGAQRFITLINSYKNANVKSVVLQEKGPLRDSVSQIVASQPESRSARSSLFSLAKIFREERPKVVFSTMLIFNFAVMLGLLISGHKPQGSFSEKLTPVIYAPRNSTEHSLPPSLPLAL